jgi:hypothetical protein
MQILLYIILVCVLIKLIWLQDITEQFTVNSDNCFPSIVHSYNDKRSAEADYIERQRQEASYEIPKALNNLKSSLYNVRGYVPQAYNEEEVHKSLMNTIIDNSVNTNTKDKNSIAIDKQIQNLTRKELLLNDAPLNMLEDYA